MAQSPTRSTTIPLLFSILLTAGVLGAAAPASASGLLADGFGGEYGHPTVDHPTAMYYNPAGLSLGVGTRLYVEAIVGISDLRYDRSQQAISHLLPPGSMMGGTPADAASANSGKARAFGAGMTPFLGAVSDFGVRGLAVGVGVYVPFGGSSSWRPNNAYQGNAQYPGAVDGVQRWWTIDGLLMTWNITAAVAYRIERAHLSLGVAANLVYTAMESLSARESSGDDDLVTSTGAVYEGRSYTQGSGVTGSLTVGAIWEPLRGLFLGLAYLSQPGFGTMTLDGTATFKLGLSPQTSSQFRVYEQLPDLVRFGVRYRWRDRFELRVSGNWVHWSVFQRQCFVDKSVMTDGCRVTDTGAAAPGSMVLANVERRWRDTFSLYASASYWVRPAIELLLGTGYDGNAIPDQTLDPAIFDSDKGWVSLGARYWFRKPKLILHLQYTQTIYRPRDIAPRTTEFDLPSRTPDAAGHYSQIFGTINLSGEYRF
jgi:long-chain fatty acid transport protein